MSGGQSVLGLHPLCAIRFTTGYALREYGAYSSVYTNTPKQSLMVLGRIFTYIPRKAPIPPNRVLEFGAIMALVEALNALGVAFTSNPTSDKQSLGKTDPRRALNPTLRNRHARLRRGVIPLPVMLLILIRCIYRLVEHAGNTDLDIDNIEKLQGLDPLLLFEWFYYGFDVALMLLNSWLWNVSNARRYLLRDKGWHLAQDGITEMLPADRDAVRSGVAELARATMQLLTFGVWRMVFPRGGNAEKPSLESEDEAGSRV
ncbi:uncharacterized protein BDV17DRAFT_295252 [Aspergillus undulatus]|uniref:uncharacterized protein n=1 Tax=Aspergillus undulatus TaxID=1810928 RepID=UPI003CCE3752